MSPSKFAAQCNSVERFAHFLEAGIKAHQYDTEARVIEGAKRIQFERETDILNAFKNAGRA